MKNKIKYLLVIICLLFSVVVITGCDNNKTTTTTEKQTTQHVHVFSGDYQSDATGHWQVCTCSEASPKDAHVYGEYVSNNDATCAQDGTKTRACLVCGYEETVTDQGSKVAHEYVTDAAKAATCTEDGLTAGEHCKNCGYVKTTQNVIPATGHNVSGQPWVSDNEKGTHYQVCQNCEGRVNEANHVYSKVQGNETVYKRTVESWPTDSADGEVALECFTCGHKSEEAIKKYNVSDFYTNNTAKALSGTDTYVLVKGIVFGIVTTGSNTELLLKDVSTDNIIAVRNLGSAYIGSTDDLAFKGFGDPEVTIAKGDTVQVLAKVKTVSSNTSDKGKLYLSDQSGDFGLTWADQHIILSHNASTTLSKANAIVVTDDASFKAAMSKDNLYKFIKLTGTFYGVQIADSKRTQFVNYTRIFYNAAATTVDETKVNNFSVVFKDNNTSFFAAKTATKMLFGTDDIIEDIASKVTFKGEVYCMLVGGNEYYYQLVILSATDIVNKAQYQTSDTEHYYVDGNGDAVSAEQHNFVLNRTIKAATHTATGQDEYICSVCNKVNKVTTDMIVDHDAAPTNANQYTYELVEGVHKHYYTCSCGDKIYDNCSFGEFTSDNNATCIADGTKSHYCSVCNHKETEEDEGSKLEHTFGELVTKVEAQCETTGMEAHYYCSSCKKYFTSDKVETTLDALTISKKGHTYGTEIAKVEPTLDSNGTKAHYECSECHEKFIYDGSSYIKVTDAELVLTIDDCEHTYSLVNATPASCESTGIIEHYHCSKCNKDFTKEGETYTEVVASQLVSSALGHTYGEIVAKVDATCTEEGVETHYYCSACQKYFNENKVEVAYSSLKISAKGHDEVTTNTTYTYDEDQSKHYYACQCGEKIYSNCDFGDFVYNNDATCTTNGTKSQTCSKCGHKTTGITDADHPATGHTIVDNDGNTIKPTGYYLINSASELTNGMKFVITSSTGYTLKLPTSTASDYGVLRERLSTITDFSTGKFLGTSSTTDQFTLESVTVEGYTGKYLIKRSDGKYLQITTTGDYLTVATYKGADIAKFAFTIEFDADGKPSIYTTVSDKNRYIIYKNISEDKNTTKYVFKRDLTNSKTISIYKFVDSSNYFDAIIEAQCLTDGAKAHYHNVCPCCKKYITASGLTFMNNNYSIAATGHQSKDFTAAWTWSDDNAYASLNLTCKCGEKIKENYYISSTYEKSTVSGECCTYTVTYTYTNGDDTKTFTNTKTVTEHIYKQYSYTITDGVIEMDGDKPAKTLSYTEGSSVGCVVKTWPTATSKGSLTYHCLRCDETHEIEIPEIISVATAKDYIAAKLAGTGTTFVDGTVYVVNGVIIDASYSGSYMDLIIKDLTTNEVIGITDVGSSKISHSDKDGISLGNTDTPIKIGDTVNVLVTFKQSGRTGVDSGKYTLNSVVESCGATWAYGAGVITSGTSADGVVTLQTSDCVKISSQDELEAFLSTANRANNAYTFVELTGSFYLTSHSKGVIISYKSTSANNAALKINNVWAYFNNNNVKFVSEKTLDQLFGTESTTDTLIGNTEKWTNATPYAFGGSIKCLYVGGNTAYAQFIILNESDIETVSARYEFTKPTQDVYTNSDTQFNFAGGQLVVYTYTDNGVVTIETISLSYCEVGVESEGTISAFDFANATGGKHTITVKYVNNNLDLNDSNRIFKTTFEIVIGEVDTENITLHAPTSSKTYHVGDTKDDLDLTGAYFEVPYVNNVTTAKQIPVTKDMISAITLVEGENIVIVNYNESVYKTFTVSADYMTVSEANELAKDTTIKYLKGVVVGVIPGTMGSAVSGQGIIISDGVKLLYVKIAIKFVYLIDTTEQTSNIKGTYSKTTINNIEIKSGNVIVITKLTKDSDTSLSTSEDSSCTVQPQNGIAENWFNISSNDYLTVTNNTELFNSIITIKNSGGNAFGIIKLHAEGENAIFIDKLSGSDTYSKVVSFDKTNYMYAGTTSSRVTNNKTFAFIHNASANWFNFSSNDNGFTGDLYIAYYYLGSSTYPYAYCSILSAGTNLTAITE